MENCGWQDGDRKSDAAKQSAAATALVTCHLLCNCFAKAAADSSGPSAKALDDRRCALFLAVCGGAGHKPDPSKNDSRIAGRCSHASCRGSMKNSSAGKLTVFENRVICVPDGRSIRTMVVLPALEPSSPAEAPLFDLAGGPGAPRLAAPAFTLANWQGSIAGIATWSWWINAAAAAPIASPLRRTPGARRIISAKCIRSIT